MAEPAPPLPGYWRFGWLLFMQPYRVRVLFSAWGLEGDPSWWALRHRLRSGDPVVRGLLWRALVWQFGATLLASSLAAGVAGALGVLPDWYGFQAGLALGACVGLVAAPALGVGAGVVSSFCFGFSSSLTFGVAFGWVEASLPEAEAGVLYGRVITWALVLATAVSFVQTRHIARGPHPTLVGGALIEIQYSVAFAIGTGLMLGLPADRFGPVRDEGWEVAVGVALPFVTAALRLPTYTIEAPATFLLARLARSGVLSPQRAARLLPFRHHDLIWFPLPGLAELLATIAETDADLGAACLAEAAESLGQKGPARAALAELQARALERAARERRYARAAALDLPFVPHDDPPAPLLPFRAAARDLDAATLSHNQRHRAAALERARGAVESARLTVAGKERPSELERRLLPTARLWLAAIDDEAARLRAERDAHPQVWSPFCVGPALTPADRALFRGRADLVRLIDQDLARERGPLLWLWGQRRMGKTSLLNLLPSQLGTGVQVVKLDFQGLSGDVHRGRPHLVLARALGLPDEPAPWAHTLDHLRALDRRVLVAIDEIERLQDGIAEGWASTDFLDFLRAAANTAPALRFLLVSAYAPPRLGPHWVDRLVDLARREVNLLGEADARSLVRSPVEDFPDIYPPGGVDRIVAQTAGHPYLLQLVCDALCRRLNEQDRLVATPDDLDAAFDRAVNETQLFDELWRQRSDAERDTLRRLARAPLAAEPLDAPTRELLAEHLLVRRAGRVEVTVPMFASWIAER